MAKKKSKSASKSKSKAKGVSPIAAASVLAELTTFEADTATTPQAKNKRLAVLLQGPWLPLAIVRIDRIEIGSQSGWRATFRT